MKTIISELAGTKQLCCVYANSVQTDRFAAGFVLQADETHVLLQAVDPYGYADGLLCVAGQAILRIETDSLYARCLQALFSYNRQTCTDYPPSGEVLQGLLRYASAGEKICSVELCAGGETDFTGRIDTIRKNCVVFDAFDAYGRPDGRQAIDPGDISRISCDSADDRKTEKLLRLRGAGNLPT